MYLDNIEIKNIAPCVAETGKIRAEARFSRDVSEIFPYLNSVIRGAAYIQQKPLLTFSKASRVFTLYPQRVTVIKAVNATDAIQVLDWLKDLINETYEKRKEIEPCHESKVSFTLHVYSRLPKTNCGDCGEKTCLAFATLLLRDEQEIINCRPLFKPENKQTRRDLFEILEALSFELPDANNGF